jgi:hypothetical protein
MILSLAHGLAFGVVLLILEGKNYLQLPAKKSYSCQEFPEHLLLAATFSQISNT